MKTLMLKLLRIKLQQLALELEKHEEQTPPRSQFYFVPEPLLVDLTNWFRDLRLLTTGKPD